MAPAIATGGTNRDSVGPDTRSAPRLIKAALDRPGLRFAALAGLGFLIVLLETLRGSNQIFDFWEHAATVRQLMLHPSNPGNALLATGSPSAFYSPYALAVALVAKLTSAGPVHALAVAGLINYWLLMAGIWTFTRVFSDRPQAPFYALLFIWLLWGVSPWKYSGFFDFPALSAVIAYPSTFATALGMLTAALWHRGPGRLPQAPLTAVGLAIVILTHPVAGAATAAALLAVSLTSPDRRRSLAALALIALVAAILCLAWPLYSITALYRDQRVFDPSNSVMYDAWALHVFPLLAALGLVVLRTGTLRRARLGIYSVPLVALFIYGGLSGHSGDGRVISYLAIGAQIGLADLAAAWEPAARRWARGGKIVLAVAALVLLGLAELYNMRGGFKGSFPGTGSEPAIYAQYRAAVNGLPASATIATPLNDGAEAAIPVFAGRLIATHRPLAFVKDQVQRQQTVYEFFSLGAAQVYRRQVLSRFHVRYIVVSTAQPALLAQLSPFGSIIRRSGAFTTIAVS